MNYTVSTAGTPPGQVGFTVDGVMYYAVAGTYNTAQIVTANSLDAAITGLRSTVGTQPSYVGPVMFTINGGESFASLYGPF